MADEPIELPPKAPRQFRRNFAGSKDARAPRDVRLDVADAHHEETCEAFCTSAGFAMYAIVPHGAVAREIAGSKSLLSKLEENA